MVPPATQEVVFATLQIVYLLVFAVGAILAMARRVRPGQRVLFGVGCGLNVLGGAGYFLVVFASSSFDYDSGLYLAFSAGRTLVEIVGVVLIVVAVCRRPVGPGYPYAPVPGPYGYPQAGPAPQAGGPGSMSALWYSDRASVLASPENISRALAEFAGTVEREYDGLTPEQRAYRADGTVLDRALGNEAEQPGWMQAPLAIRQIGHRVNAIGGRPEMQRVADQARGWSGSAATSGIIDQGWNGIGAGQR